MKNVGKRKKKQKTKQHQHESRAWQQRIYVKRHHSVEKERKKSINKINNNTVGYMVKLNGTKSV